LNKSSVSVDCVDKIKKTVENIFFTATLLGIILILNNFLFIYFQCPYNQFLGNAKWSDRVKDAVAQLDRELDENLHKQELIGKETETHSPDRVHIKARAVTFSWQRGIKIGIYHIYFK